MEVGLTTTAAGSVYVVADLSRVQCDRGVKTASWPGATSGQARSRVGPASCAIQLGVLGRGIGEGTGG